MTAAAPVKFTNPRAIREFARLAQRALTTPKVGYRAKAAEARRACELLESAVCACLRAGIALPDEKHGLAADLDAVRARIRAEAEGLEGFACAGLTDEDEHQIERA
jgi:hypothetical protein